MKCRPVKKSGYEGRKTVSVCPVCLKQVNARWRERNGVMYLEKKCDAHGEFSVPVWRGKIDITKWLSGLREPETNDDWQCPNGCGNCGGHSQESCCVLLEVTRRCNLKCRFCFADGAMEEPSAEALHRDIQCIAEKGKRPLLQLSGGEPTLRDDLPELIKFAREQGIPYVQLNSNGLRLAEDEEYTAKLADAGLDFVFMQFDGTDDYVYKKLRGVALVEKKLKAIENCGKYGLGVTLVPTVVRGINDSMLGEIVRFGSALSPVVRGVHFQPVSYFGRIPENPSADDRYTLDELVSDLYNQAKLPEGSLRPSRCDHQLCGFHGSFIAAKNMLISMAGKEQADCCCGADTTTPKQNREFVGRHWKRSPGDTGAEAESADINTLDGFSRLASQRGFTITAMAFQDAMNLDVQRLRRCSLHVWDNGVLKPFCARYLTPMTLS